jgi:hypothetical protein
MSGFHLIRDPELSFRCKISKVKTMHCSSIKREAHALEEEEKNEASQERA